MKNKLFYAKCPYCDEVNSICVTKEEIDNDYDLSCDFCDKQYPISVWIGEEEKTK